MIIFGRKVIKNGFIVPNIVKNINGDYYCNIENNYIVVYTFINGEQYGPKIENIENIEQQIVNMTRCI